MSDEHRGWVVREAPGDHRGRRRVWNDLYARDGRRYGDQPSVAAQLTVPLVEPWAERGRPGEPPSLLIELGCGYGRDLFFFRAVLPRLPLRGVDWAESALDLLVEECGARQLTGLEAICRDVPREPGALVPCGAVFSNSFFHYFDPEERAAIFDSCARNLVAGGLFVGAFVSARDRRVGGPAANADGGVYVYPGRVWYPFTGEGLGEELSRHGFSFLREPIEVVELEQIATKREPTRSWFVVAVKAG